MNKLQKILIFLAILGAIIFMVERKKKQGFACPSSKTPLPIEVFATTNIAPSKKSLPLLLELGSDQCVPCKLMAPILDELKEDYVRKLEIKSINVRKNKAAIQTYAIRVIPTQIFYHANGTELFRHEGFISKEDILSKWEEMKVSL